MGFGRSPRSKFEFRATHTMTCCWSKKMDTGGNAASFAINAFILIREHLVRMQSAFPASINPSPAANGHQHNHGSKKLKGPRYLRLIGSSIRKPSATCQPCFSSDAYNPENPEAIAFSAPPRPVPAKMLPSVHS